MSETKTITLAGKAYAVPPLPLRANRVVYPLCRKLVQAQLIERCIAAGGTLDCDDDEFEALLTLVHRAAQAADPALSRDAFDELAVTPPELLDAFFSIRYQTGAWVPAVVTPVDGNPDLDAAPGEAAGAPAKPRRPRK